VVVNPSHYLNAIEYVYQQGGKDDHIAIMTRHTKGIQEIDKLGVEGMWSEIYRMEWENPGDYRSDKEFFTRSQAFLHQTFEKCAPDEIIVGNLVDGNLYPFILKIKNNVSAITVLDDGTPTLNVADKRNGGNFYQAYHFRSLRILAKNILYQKIFPPAYRPPRNITFFSLFNFPLPEGDKLINNDYSWVRSKVKENPQTNEFLFIGSHIVDRKLVTEENYLWSLKKVMEDVSGTGLEFKYVHHRSESDHMKKKISEICNTTEFNMPLELMFLDKPRPAMFAGHFSSALFTLSRIFPALEIRAYLFPEKMILGSEYESREYILRVQKALETDATTKHKYLA